MEETSITAVTEETTVETLETPETTLAPDVVSGVETSGEVNSYPVLDFSDVETSGEYEDTVCMLLQEQNTMLYEMNERSVKISGMIEMITISLILYLVFKLAWGILDIFKP